MFRLHDTLTRGKSEEKIEILEDSFQASTSFLKELKALLESRIENKIKESENSTNYETPSWSEYQADSIGYRRAIREILNLFVDNKVKDKK